MPLGLRIPRALASFHVTAPAVARRCDADLVRHR